MARKVRLRVVLVVLVVAGCGGNQNRDERAEPAASRSDATQPSTSTETPQVPDWIDRNGLSWKQFAAGYRAGWMDACEEVYRAAVDSFWRDEYESGGGGNQAPDLGELPDCTFPGVDSSRVGPHEPSDARTSGEQLGREDGAAWAKSDVSGE